MKRVQGLGLGIRADSMITSPTRHRQTLRLGNPTDQSLHIPSYMKHEGVEWRIDRGSSLAEQRTSPPAQKLKVPVRTINTHNSNQH